MKTSKKVMCLAFLLLFFALPLLTACHGSKGIPEFTIPEEFDTLKQYEITFWAKNDTNKVQTEIYKKAITDFEALYPNVKVNMRLYNDYAKIYNDVITNISTRTTPNVCITYPDHVATYLSGSNVVIPLDELMSNEKYGLGGEALLFDSPKAEEVIPEFLKEGVIADTQYALPFMRSTEALYINKTFVNALGYEIPDVLTWDFIFEVSEAAMEKDEEGFFKINSQKVMIPFIYKSTDNMMIQMVKQKGSAYSSEEGEILLFNDDTKALLETIGEHAETGAFSTFKISSYPANFLNAGQCIFAIDSTAGATWMGSEAPLLDISEDALVDFETVVRPIPQFDIESPKMISQGPSVCIFNKDDPGEVLASWLFAQFLLTDDVQIAYSQTEGYIPVTSKAQNTAVYKDYLSRAGEDNDTYYKVKIEASSLLLSHTADTFTTPVWNGSASLREAAGDLIESVVKAKRRKQTVDDAFYEKLFDNTKTSIMKEESDEGLPKESKALLISLIGVWILIGAYVFTGELRKRMQKPKDKQ